MSRRPETTFLNLPDIDPKRLRTKRQRRRLTTILQELIDAADSARDELETVDDTTDYENHRLSIESAAQELDSQLGEKLDNYVRHLFKNLTYKD